MADISYYEQLIEAPEVRSMLDLIATAEGTAGKGDNGYNVMFGGKTFDGYDKHPNKRHNFRQTDGRRNKTTAAGRYQFLNRTAKGLQKELGLNDFTPRSQDIMAVKLFEQNGALEDVLAGDMQTAVSKLGKTWASLPSSNYPQPKKSYGDLFGGSETAQTSSVPATMPVSMVMQNGQQMFAIPETPEEQGLMEQFHLSGYSPDMQSRLTQALGQITEAQREVLPSVPLLSDLPNDLDKLLIDLIRRA